VLLDTVVAAPLLDRHDRSLAVLYAIAARIAAGIPLLHNRFEAPVVTFAGVRLRHGTGPVET